MPQDSSSEASSLDVLVHHPAYTESVPLDLPEVANEAVSRQISRIQSRRSAATSDAPVVDSDAASANSIAKVYSISEDPKFNRFTLKKKRFYVAVASISCFLSPLSGLAFLPAVPEIASRFNTTGEVINLSAAVYCVFMSLLPCVFSPVSDIYGRRTAFLICSSAYVVCLALLAVSVNLAMFFVFRAFTALFATAFFSIGAHIVGDLFIPTQRGEQMSWVISGAQLGTAFGAVGGGIIVNFTSWRVIFWVLAGIGLTVFLSAFFMLPETLVETKHQIVLQEIRIDHPKRKFVFIPFNPLRVIRALKYPTLFIDGYIVIALVFNMYSLVTPIRYVMDPRFGLHKPIYSGLFYLAPGCGYLVGSLYGGKWADKVVKQWIEIRGRRVPEDRLRQVLIPLGVMYPLSILIYGWCMEKEKGGMAVPIIFMFTSGLAQTFVFPASNTYCVDSMPELAGDAIGLSYFSRYLAAAVASAVCLRSINTIGVGWTCTYSAAMLWLGVGCAVVLIFFGEEWRMKSLVANGLRSQEDWDEIKRLRQAEGRFGLSKVAKHLEHQEKV